MKVFVTVLAIAVLILTAYSAQASSVDVSGYTDKGVYVHGDLDINSDGSVDGYVYTDHGKSIHVEGEIESGGTVEIDNDSWGGGGYDLDID
ncbi:MAG: hypothetical protein NT140_05610 [Deltaproteobacteria bacterium]|nr:hypothetical protein [Deltaproteobacteria bacterium]